MSTDEFLLASLKQLSEITGISASQWSRYFHGVVSPKESTLNQAAEKLNITPSEFLDVFQKRRQWLTSQQQCSQSREQ